MTNVIRTTTRVERTSFFLNRSVIKEAVCAYIREKSRDSEGPVEIVFTGDPEDLCCTVTFERLLP